MALDVSWKADFAEKNRVIKVAYVFQNLSLAQKQEVLNLKIKAGLLAHKREFGFGALQSMLNSTEILIDLFYSFLAIGGVNRKSQLGERLETSKIMA